MLLHVHLGHRVGDLAQRRRRAAAGDDRVLQRRPCLQCGDHFRQRQPVVLEGVGQLVEDDEVDRRVGEVAAGDLPGGSGGTRVAFAILRLPGEAKSAASPIRATRPMPCIVTGCLTPGSADGTHGAPFIIASICTSPNASVEFKEGTVNTSRLG